MIRQFLDIFPSPLAANTDKRCVKPVTLLPFSSVAAYSRHNAY